jgi:hypothetical protein
MDEFSVFRQRMTYFEGVLGSREFRNHPGEFPLMVDTT